jgi:hypothetical protein
LEIRIDNHLGIVDQPQLPVDQAPFGGAEGHVVVEAAVDSVG